MAIITACLAATMSASADLLVDRGLPTENLNNAAGSDRANVAWAFTQYTSPDYWVVGDTFQNTSSQTWDINQITLWTVGTTASASLWGGIDGSSAIGVVSASGAVSPATYADGSTYQGSSGSSIAMYQVNFAVNIALAAGQTYDFFLDGTGSGDGTVVPFVHASNAALSGSTQDGADNSMLGAEVINGVLDPTSVGTWDSNGNGWDKSSDVNVQVSGTPAPVPEPATVISGALLLLPFGAGAIRIMRKRQMA